MKSALDIALDYLSRRSLTRHELKVKLERKDYTNEEIREVMERVEGWGYVNDRALALSFAQSRLLTYSKKRVQQDLLRRGVSASTIQEVFEHVFSPSQELEQCLELAKKMWLQEARRWENSYQYKKTYAKFPRTHFLQQKVGQKLAQKGYSMEVIRQALEEVEGLD